MTMLGTCVEIADIVKNEADAGRIGSRNEYVLKTSQSLTGYQAKMTLVCLDQALMLRFPLAISSHIPATFYHFKVYEVVNRLWEFVKKLHGEGHINISSCTSEKEVS